MKSVKPVPAFSDELEIRLKGNGLKTLRDLSVVFEERSFAITAMLLMFIPALPLPTGGVTHVFEIIVGLLALEMIVGLKMVWLPQRWGRMKLGKVIEGRALPAIIKRIRWFEARSTPRWPGIFKDPTIVRILGIVILFFTTVAFFSPPFSGLDTLPSLGVVLICLAMILEDALILLIGLTTGIIGSALSIGFGALIIELLKQLF